jgi:hypothetical protein
MAALRLPSPGFSDSLQAARYNISQGTCRLLSAARKKAPKKADAPLVLSVLL